MLVLVRAGLDITGKGLGVSGGEYWCFSRSMMSGERGVFGNGFSALLRLLKRLPYCDVRDGLDCVVDSVVLPARALGLINLLVRVSTVPPGMRAKAPTLPGPRRALVTKSLLSEVEYEASRSPELVSKDVTASCEPVGPRVSSSAMLDHDV